MYHGNYNVFRGVKFLESFDETFNLLYFYSPKETIVSTRGRYRSTFSTHFHARNRWIFHRISPVLIPHLLTVYA